MRTIKLATHFSLGVVLVVGAPGLTLAADAPAAEALQAAPTKEEATEPPVEPSEAEALVADEGIPAADDDAAEDNGTVVEGEQPKK